MQHVILVIMLVAVLFVWMVVATQITEWQRRKVLDLVFDDNPNWRQDQKLLQKVHFNDHFYRVLFLQNPWWLYDESIRPPDHWSWY